MSIRWREGLAFVVDPDTPGMDYTMEWSDWLDGETVDSFTVTATDGAAVVSAVLDEVGGTAITAVVKRATGGTSEYDEITWRVVRATTPPTGTDRTIRVVWRQQ